MISADLPGPRLDGSGVTFRIESSVAEAIELCIFDGKDERRVEMAEEGGSFSVRVPGLGMGARYGFRVHGPWSPNDGDRCNPAKLLLDPYARRMEGMVSASQALTGHQPGKPGEADPVDSAPFTMRSIVTDDSFDWAGDRRPGVPLAESVIYETHVKGITKLHPGVPPGLRGTYRGLSHPAVIEHLIGLGVTAVELLPVQQFVHDQRLLASGRRNYWGYSPIGFFAPHNEYSIEDPVIEFKQMVKELHAAGLEVILDVVYNHTAEGNHHGPTLSFRGLDNRSWYLVDPSRPARYLDWTGTGNTLDFAKEAARSLTLASLRYWATEMHVDGFRFDLATVLGRAGDNLEPRSDFLEKIAGDPELAGVKLIAEPWDLGPGGYRLGAFPSRWSEWNDQYRDAVRDFWKGTQYSLSNFATRITGSSDIYERGARRPQATINYVTSHDGFTLADLVSYNVRHNHANGEYNRDGHPDNRSWNSGVEGPASNPEVIELRARRRRSLLTTLFVSQGVPMLLGGDEIGRTQEGNNNAYNQDNRISWYDWERADSELNNFVGRLARLRARHPTFRRTAWLHEHVKDVDDHVGWFTSTGSEMAPVDWTRPRVDGAFALYLDGSVVHTDHRQVADTDFLLFFNGTPDPVSFTLPVTNDWEIAVDTVDPARGGRLDADQVVLAAFGMLVLSRTQNP